MNCTLILAARDHIKESLYNSALVPVHGKPAIAWVLDSVPEEDFGIIIVNELNTKLKDYIAKCYPHIHVVTIDEDTEIERVGRFSILSSLLAGLKNIEHCDLLRLNFGDTLCRDIPDTFRDMMLISTDIL